MARVHIWHFLLNKEGQPIEGATIQAYLAGTETQATIYHQEEGGSPDAIGQVTTISNGYYEFWIADDSEIGGYSADQKIKIAWDKAGIQSGYVDYVDVFSESLTYYPVDVQDNSTTFDKLVSNYYGYTWTNHVTGMSYNDGAHDIYSVDETNTSTVKNRLVSNYQMYTINADTSFLSASITANDVDISNLQSDVAALSGGSSLDTAFLSAAIDTNTSNISSLTTSVNTNTSNISANNTAISDNAVSIVSLQQQINNSVNDVHYDEGTVSGSLITIQLSAGRFHTLTLVGNVSASFNGWPTSGYSGHITVETSAVGAPTLTFTDTVITPGGTSFTITPSGIDVFTFYSYDGGSNIRGFQSGEDMK